MQTPTDPQFKGYYYRVLTPSKNTKQNKTQPKANCKRPRLNTKSLTLGTQLSNCGQEKLNLNLG